MGKIPKKCSYQECNNNIPFSRKGSARYCSDECYYEAKKIRSNTRYAVIKQPYNRVRYFENALANLHWAIQLDKTITVADLVKAGLDLGFSNAEKMYKNKMFKVIGKYAYHIDPGTKIVEIYEL